MKAKTFLKLKLTEKEFEKNKNKTLKQLESKFVIFKASDIQLEALKKSSFKKFKKAYKNFLIGCFDLEEKNIPITQYNLRKYCKCSYKSSVKYLPKLAEIKSKIENIKATSFYASSNSEVKVLSDVELYFYYYEEIELNLNEFSFLMDNFGGNED